MVSLLVACQEKRVSYEDVPFESSLSTVRQLSSENRCIAAYDQLGLEGGCYPSRETVDEAARQVVAALEESGWVRRNLLRKDFGTWTVVMIRGNESLACAVEELSSSSEGQDQQLFREGYRSLVNLTLNRDVTQTGADTASP